LLSSSPFSRPDARDYLAGVPARKINCQHKCEYSRLPACLFEPEFAGMLSALPVALLDSLSHWSPWTFARKLLAHRVVPYLPPGHIYRPFHATSASRPYERSLCVPRFSLVGVRRSIYVQLHRSSGFSPVHSVFATTSRGHRHFSCPSNATRPTSRVLLLMGLLRDLWTLIRRTISVIDICQVPQHSSTFSNEAAECVHDLTRLQLTPRRRVLHAYSPTDLSPKVSGGAPLWHGPRRSVYHLRALPRRALHHYLRALALY